MKTLFFSPKGRINKHAFLKGVMIIALIYAALSLLTYLVKPLGLVFSFISLLLYVPFIFLMIKRSHDGGKSGWLSVAWFILWAGVTIVFSTIMILLTQLDLVQEYFTLSLEAVEAGDKAAQNEIAESFSKSLSDVAMLPMIPFGFLGTMAGAYLINLLIGKDPHDNQYGPAT